LATKQKDFAVLNYIQIYVGVLKVDFFNSGNCNKDKSDEMKTSDGVLSNDVDEFGYSWLVKNLPKGTFFVFIDGLVKN
jgi:hypothetical protein